MTSEEIWKKIENFSDDDLKCTLGALWYSIAKGTISRRDPYDTLNPDDYKIEDWEMDLCSEAEKRGISLSNDISIPDFTDNVSDYLIEKM